MTPIVVISLVMAVLFGFLFWVLRRHRPEGRRSQRERNRYDDPLFYETVTRTFQTGKPHLGTRDDHGNVWVQPLDEYHHHPSNDHSHDSHDSSDSGGSHHD
jgi:hypothetical protein